MPKTDQSTVSDFLQALAGPSAAPGGGGAAAVSGAMGAALLSMCCRLTLGRPRFAAAEAALTEILAQAESLQTQLVDLAEADQRAFEQVMAAYGHPQSTPAEKEARMAAIDAALLAATRAPLEAVSACARLIRLTDQAIDQINPNALGDAAAGVRLVRAGLETAQFNMAINLGLLADPQPIPEFQAALQETLVGLDQTTRRIFTYVHTHSEALLDIADLSRDTYGQRQESDE